MIANNEYIVVTPPKTGSTSLNCGLMGTDFRVYMPVHGYSDEHHQNNQKPILLVRDPIKRWLSTYRFGHKLIEKGFDKGQLAKSVVTLDSFADWFFEKRDPINLNDKRNLPYYWRMSFSEYEKIIKTEEWMTLPEVTQKLSLTLVHTNKNDKYKLEFDDVPSRIQKKVIEWAKPDYERRECYKYINV